MKQLLFLVIAFYLTGCTQKAIVKEDDIIKYTQSLKTGRSANKLTAEISFWEKRLAKDPYSYVNMYQLGSLYLTLFRHNGKITSLLKGDSLLKQSGTRLNNTDPEILQALAQVSITKHKFRDALFYNKEAKKNNASDFVYAMIDFDASMELGSYSNSASILQMIDNSKSFDYLIRHAKYLDHAGDLERAIKIQEAAFEKVKETNNLNLYTWALSNLGDMYGHAGRVKDAYNCYLQVLAKDPSYVYALKGIAWIAFAHDKKPNVAKNTISFIQSQNFSPDYDLFLAEIAEYEGNNQLKDYYNSRFINLVNTKEYNGMYNTTLIDLFCEREMYKEALEIALKETDYRPTPETYSLLAWTHYKMGNTNEAIRLYTNYIAGRSFDPSIKLRSAYITLAAGKLMEAKNLFAECLESEFELGPVKSKEITKMLANIKNDTVN